jgi:N-methylhydantoinase A/oxoprolinase/acetone carboxylase beta subunit
MFTVDIDTGGTMTDALVSDGKALQAFKVDTTPHDYTVSFRECLSEAARHFGFPSVSKFLDEVKLIRWSSTITSNVLGERRGAKVGLLVSKGHEHGLYGKGTSPVVDELVAEENVIGLPPQSTAQDVLAAVKRLLEDGVRRICISLQGTFPDSQAETEVKRIIERQYPDHYLGAVPVVLGSEMAQTPHDTTRTHYSLINSYVHSQLAASLFNAEDILKYEERWDGPLLIGHTNGGVAQIGKTKAVDTIESGPVFGTFGGAYFARAYGNKNALCFDVGGTTTKASVIREGEPLFQRKGDLVAIPVESSLAVLRSAVLGGGSIARPDKDGEVSLGPESMGASPGPACYGLGGAEATLTDALLVLGLLDPAAFLGGRRMLNVERAKQAIEAKLATPLGVSVERAAELVRDEAVSVMADLVESTLSEAGLDASAVSLFAYGGNGPLFGALVAERLGTPDVVVFWLSPVFSAFGSAISDVVHVYERGINADLADPGADARVDEAVQAMRAVAARDLNAEGFSLDRSRTVLEADLTDGKSAVVTVRTSGNGHDLSAAALSKAAQQQPGAKGRRPDTVVQAIRLKTTYPIGAYELPRSAKTTAEPKSSGSRKVVLSGNAVDTQICLWRDLPVGSSIAGPAVVSAETLTCLVPPHWTLTIDEYGNGRLRGARKS